MVVDRGFVFRRCFLQSHSVSHGGWTSFRSNSNMPAVRKRKASLGCAERVRRTGASTQSRKAFSRCPQPPDAAPAAQQSVRKTCQCSVLDSFVGGRFVSCAVSRRCSDVPSSFIAARRPESTPAASAIFFLGIRFTYST